MRDVELSRVPTPSLLLDAGRVRQNAVRMGEVAHSEGVRLRPHIKTHKCVEVARIQTAGHDGGVTVSTLAEARAFAANGFDDITYAVPIEQGKFAEVIDIIRGGVDLNVITDDVATAGLLDAAAAEANVQIGVFLKVDCGYHRCGVEPDEPAAMAIPRAISDATNLDLVGILTHAGHSYHARTKEELLATARQERDVMVEFSERLRCDGIEVPTVSIGSTPTMSAIDHLDGIDEIRPGNYIFFDAFQATLGSCGFDDCALTVLTAVTHVSQQHRKIIVDAGGIALSKDRGAVEFDAGCGYGRVLDLEGSDLGLRVGSLSQEHGEILVEDDTIFDTILVGSRLRILANHSCLTAAQHTHYNVLDDGEIVDRWKIHSGW
ncbi:MAG: alanine racemase [Pyrinomonadaceae bacterium]